MTTIIPDFQLHGACGDEDPELFFPVTETRANEAQIAEAKAVCARCPVKAVCRAYALAHPGQTTDGIWGGMTEDERRAVRARGLKRERELATAQASDEAAGEQLPGEDDQQDQSASPALPSYQAARQRLGRARRALAQAQEAGDADAIAHAEDRVADAERLFEAVRVQDTAGAVA